MSGKDSSAEDTSAEDSAESGRPDRDNPLKPRPRLRKIILWIGGLTIVVVAVLIALPIAVAWYAEGWLRDNGADAARIDDVDINLFTGVVRVTGLHASGGERERLELGSAEIGIRWWPLASKRIYVEFLELADGHIDVVAADDGVWQIGALVIRPGEATPADEPAEIEVGAGSPISWGFGSDVIALTGLQLTYRDQLFDTTVDVREVMLGSQFTWDTGRTTALKVDLSIDGSPLLLTSDLQPWAERRQFTGALKLTDLKLSDYQQVLNEMAGLADPRGTINFDLQMNVVYDADNTLELKVSGPLEVRNASFSLAGAAITNETLGWDGELRLKLPAPETGPLLRVAGALKLSGSDVRLEALELDTRLNSFGWSGNVEFAPARSADAAAEVAMQASLTGTGFALNHDRLPFLVAGLATFDVPSAQVNGMEQISAQSIQLQGLRLIGHADEAKSVAEVFSLGQLDVEGFDFDSNGLTAETMTLRAPHASLTRNAQGEFEDVDAAIAAFTNTGEATPDQAKEGEPAVAPEPSAPLKVSVGSVKIQADDLLRFEDRTVTPTAIFKLTKTDLELTNVDISGDAPMTVALATGDGDMNFTMQGTVNVFADTLVADLAVQLAALDLPQLSSYVPGYNIERGRLKADSKVVINGNALDVQNALEIDRLSLSGKAAEGNDAVAQGLAMPIDVALDLLRDGDDRIKLQVPITGSLDNFSIGTGDIIRQATQKALQNAALSYVKTALQPLGTLLLVGNLAVKATRPRFEPVEMAPGDASLSGVGRQYLQKLGALLGERPGLRLTICGVATPGDRAALARIAEASAAREIPDAPDAATNPDSGDSELAAPEITNAQLLELAALRTSAVIDFLVNEQGVAKKRLFACRETIEASEKASPRTEISL